MEEQPATSSSSLTSSSTLTKIKKLGCSHLHPYLTAENTCLQVVFDPEVVPEGAAVLCSTGSLCWSSENISIDLPQTTWQRWSYYSSDLIQISNRTQNPVYIALSNVGCGKILELPLTNSNPELFVIRSHFLCTSSLYNVILHPILSGNLLQNPLKWVCLTSYRVTKPQDQESGIVYVQASSEIMKKRLGTNESIRLRSSCLVALDTRCTVRGSTYTSIIDSIVSSKGFDLVVVGPGDVYFSHNTVVRRKVTEYGNSLNRSGDGNAALLLKLISLIVTTMFILTVTRLVEFEILDGNQFFDGNNDPFNPPIQHQPPQQGRAGRGWQL